MLLAAGRWCARRPKRTVAAWLLLLISLAAAVGAFGRVTSEAVTIPGSDSQAARDTAGAFADAASGRQPVVLYAPADAAPLTSSGQRRAVEEAARAIEGVDHVVAVTTPYEPAGGGLGADGRTGRLTVELDVGGRDITPETTRAITDAAAPAARAGIEVTAGGDLAAAEDKGSTGHSEVIGLAAAFVVLALGFGSLVAAGVPLLTGAVGLGVSLCLIGLAGHLMDMPSSGATIAAMIGLGVGIDYTLFCLTRFRELLTAGVDVEEAAARTTAGSGKAVVFAGSAVVAALAGLAFGGLPLLHALALAPGIAVLVAMAATLTLLPAVLSLLGPRLAPTARGDRKARNERKARERVVRQEPGGRQEPDDRGEPEGAGTAASGAGRAEAATGVPGPVRLRVPGAGSGTDRREEPAARTGAERPETLAARSRPVDAHPGAGPAPAGWGRIAAFVASRPWRCLLAALALTGVLAVPATQLTYGQLDAGDKAAGTASRTSYDRLADAFGPGANGPLQVVSTLPDPASGPDDARITAVSAALRTTGGVASVGPAQLDASGTRVRWQVTPTTAPSDPDTVELVHRLRDETLPRAGADAGLVTHVGGATAAQADLNERLTERMPLVVGFVLAVAALLLLVAFRSPVVAVKAALMNLVSVAASYGVLTAVFQWGWGATLIGLEGPVPIPGYVPLLMFAVLFGLAMDYEVFLLSAVRAAYLRDGDNRGAVITGLAATGRIITSAALIMVSVFLGYLLSDDPVVKMFGIGLATAVALDATVVRGVLVPATMVLLGRANWWLPDALDRLLPRLAIEDDGHDDAEPPSPATGGAPLAGTRSAS
ncbi:MMPL family transporter [Streptomyces wuyuanensis]|uniref:Putative drug exporter of the RND superfamily n=1 Tax=Streptomyces wuyuanensis TaxID=1196353 RepID=A0A1H0AVR5_9ACTN|nr:MMPL family transporter [Streptomyces wuyuanensis]SDN37464.1 putative drug exporter of the RND superfamily [Streptomyces wuyuanensis]